MVSLSTLLAVGIDGLAFGAFLALLGLAITLVFGLGEVLNLAIGVFSILAVMLATLVLEAGFGLAIASVAALLLVGLFGLVVDQTLLSLVYRSEGEQRILLGIFTTLGLAVMLDGILILRFPGSYTLPLDVEGVQFADTVITGSSLVIIAIVAVVIGVLFAFLRRTYIGKATRTVFQDERGANLVGVNPRRIRTIIFVLSVVVAALGGLVFAFGRNVSVSSGFTFTVFALIVSIVGGVRSLTGAVVAGVLLGLVNTYANFFVGSYIAASILFLTAIAVLLIEPEAIST
ncbi:MAG: branched-chain amino acid ABC transporter permease [Halobacteriales archaeon]